MLFMNKTEYAVPLFSAVYKYELKKTLLILRIVAGLMIAAWAFELYLSMGAGVVNPGDVYYLILGGVFMLASFVLPGWLGKRQGKKLSKRGVYGIHTIRVYDDRLTLRYDSTGEEKTIPLTQITRITKIDNYFKLSTGGKSTYIAIDGFELGDAGEFFLLCEEYAQLNQQSEAAEVEASKEQIRRARNNMTRKGLPYASDDSETEEEEEEFDEAAYDAKNPKSIFGKAMLNTYSEDEEDDEDDDIPEFVAPERKRPEE